MRPLMFSLVLRSHGMSVKEMHPYARHDYTSI
jgi:hypothetical protein